MHLKRSTFVATRRLYISSGYFAHVVADVDSIQKIGDILGDIGGVVGDAFEIAYDEHQFERCFQRVHIARHGMKELAGDSGHEAISLVVVFQYLLGLLPIAIEKGADAAGNHG